MSREILFRGKIVDNGEWVYGCLINYLRDKKPRIITCELFGEEQHAPDYKEVNYEVIPETIGQYVGVEDKNGTKIFEGDIVERIYKYEVKFKDGGFYLHNLDGHHLRIQDLKSDFKVIGNIHENQE